MEYLSEKECTATKIWYSGAWEVSAIIGGYREHRTYYGYSRRQAIRAFVAHFCR